MQMPIAFYMNESQLVLTSSHLDDIIQHYIFPVQFILGVTGNCINLVVLLSKGMRSEVHHPLLKERTQLTSVVLIHRDSLKSLYEEGF